MSRTSCPRVRSRRLDIFCLTEVSRPSSTAMKVSSLFSTIARKPVHIRTGSRSRSMSRASPTGSRNPRSRSEASSGSSAWRPRPSRISTSPVFGRIRIRLTALTRRRTVTLTRLSGVSCVSPGSSSQNSARVICFTTTTPPRLSTKVRLVRGGSA